MTISGLDNPGFESWKRQEIFFYLKPSRLTPRPIQPPVKWPGCEVDHSPPSSMEVKSGAISLLPLYAFGVWTGTTLPLPLPLQNVSCINGDKQNNVRNKIRECSKGKIVYKGITDLKKGYQHAANLKDEKVDLLADSHIIVNRCRNCFCLLLNVLGVNDIEYFWLSCFKVLIHLNVKSKLFASLFEAYFHLGVANCDVCKT